MFIDCVEILDKINMLELNLGIKKHVSNDDIILRIVLLINFQGVSLSYSFVDDINQMTFKWDVGCFVNFVSQFPQLFGVGFYDFLRPHPDPVINEPDQQDEYAGQHLRKNRHYILEIYPISHIRNNKILLMQICISSSL